MFSSTDDDHKPLRYMTLGGKCMVGQTGDMLDIARDMALTTHFDNPVRLRQLVVETKADLEVSTPERTR
jgi:Zn-dependent M16 (insulinase) family peptidase